jgi:hypothetical protein
VSSKEIGSQAESNTDMAGPVPEPEAAAAARADGIIKREEYRRFLKDVIDAGPEAIEWARENAELLRGY